MNPVLSEIRECTKDATDWYQGERMIRFVRRELSSLVSTPWPDRTRADVEHARKVLSRWLDVFGRS